MGLSLTALQPYNDGKIMPYSDAPFQNDTELFGSLTIISAKGVHSEKTEESS